MEKSTKSLSDIITFTKYARYLEDKGRRETYTELVDRNKNMHIEKFPHLAGEISKVYDDFVMTKKVLPSMRSFQFAGKAVKVSNARIFNCSYLPIDSIFAFPEIMFLLLSGCGVGVSVRKNHIAKLPKIRGTKSKQRRFLVEDSIMGWADAVRALVRAYTEEKSDPLFDFREIRPKGSVLVTSGGKAPGPDPLRICLDKIRSVLNGAIGRRLHTVEAYDIACHIADAVLAGGIRRAAIITGFDYDDCDMLYSKSGSWWENNPQRGRSNNSVILDRGRIDRAQFDKIWKSVKGSGCGEPGIVWLEDEDSFVNPCQPGWATVLTKNGISTIGEISIGDEIWSEDGWVTVSNKRSTGVKDVYRYRTNSGVFYGTENHRVVSGGVKVEAASADSIDLLHGPSCEIAQYDPQDIVDGVVFGDGMTHQASNDKTFLCVGEDDGDYFNSEISEFIGKKRDSLGSCVYEVSTTMEVGDLGRTFDRIVPSRFLHGGKDKVAGFLRGLYSANGSVVRGRVVLKATSSGAVEQIQAMLSSLGIRSYITTNRQKEVAFSNGKYMTRESYDINITSDRKKFQSCIGFLQGYKNEKLAEVVDRRVGNTKKTYDITSVDYVSTEEVFDITVDGASHTYWTGGCNVSNCSEIGLDPYSFCNLVEINGSTIDTQDEFNARAKAAAFIATLQASYTDFIYLRDIWKENAEKDALIGVGITGIASQKLLDLDEGEAAKTVNAENERVASLIGINVAKRTTCVKPAGTTSALLGTSSGIHPWYADYFIRRIRVGKAEALYGYLKEKMPQLVEDCVFKPHLEGVASFPIKAPEGAITRSEQVSEFLSRVKRYNENWIAQGKRDADSKINNNVSCTVSIKDDEWDYVGQWMWENRNSYTGISVLPFDGGTYQQAPFEEIDEQRYNEMLIKMGDIDVAEIVEGTDNTDVKGEAACAGGSCEI